MGLGIAAALTLNVQHAERAIAATTKREARRAGSNAPADLIRKAEWQMRGKSLESKMVMRVVRNGQVRKLEFLLWAQGTDRATVKVLAPEKDRQTGSLRIRTDLWSYNPTVDRVQKVAPSTMKLAWMGADFSNGDLVRSTNLSRFYDHRSLGEEKIDNQTVVKIESVPRRGAPVEDGKIISWLTPNDGVQLRQDYYTGDGKLDKSVTSKNLKKQGDHTYPGTLIVTRAGESGNYTQVDYLTMKFDQPIRESVFTQEFLRKRID